MADRKAVNKYYPPDWDPSKGSINRYNNSHPLRARARKLDQGILVIRFAMPFNIWCSGCNNHVGQGVRYNAEKSKIGNYYDTPIYEFKMKCRLCDNFYVLKTDPANLDYAIVSGARKQAQQEFLDELDDADVAARLESAEEAKRRITDSMFKLEKQLEDKIKSDANKPSLQDIKKWRSRWEDDFSINQLVRSQFRKRRKKIEQSKERDRKLLKKASLKITLKTPTQSVRDEAKRLSRDARASKIRNSESTRKRDLLIADKFITRTSTRTPRIKIRDSPVTSSSRRAEHCDMSHRIKKEL